MYEYDDDYSTNQYNDQPSTYDDDSNCYQTYDGTTRYVRCTSGSSTDPAAAGAIVGGALLIVTICIAAAVVSLIGQWKVFKKMHHKGWEALIGGHNIYVILEASGLNPVLFFLSFIPIVGQLILLFWSTNALAKSFGKGTGYGIGLALLGVIFFPMLGFGNAKYLGPIGGKDSTPSNSSNNSESTTASFTTDSTDDSTKTETIQEATIVDKPADGADTSSEN